MHLIKSIGYLLIGSLIFNYSFIAPAFAEEMVLVPGGTYQRGDTFGDGASDEKPVQETTVSDFYLDKYEVTQKEYQQLRGENPSRFVNCDDCPVENVNWSDAQDYCENVGKRLPTEAEWEYAARSGGKQEKWAGADASPALYAWYSENSGNRTQPVGQKKPNGLGIYDMSGNVWEWCQDWYDKNYYVNSPKDNPEGPDSGAARVLRGGSWHNYVNSSRNSARHSTNPEDKYSFIGFRCARSK